MAWLLVMVWHSVVVGKKTPKSVYPLENCGSFHRNPHTNRSYTQRNSCLQTATAGGLTTGAGQSSPAWLTLAGVGGHTVAMNTALFTMSWIWKTQEHRNQYRDRHKDWLKNTTLCSCEVSQNFCLCRLSLTEFIIVLDKIISSINNFSFRTLYSCLICDGSKGGKLDTDPPLSTHLTNFCHILLSDCVPQVPNALGPDKSKQLILLQHRNVFTVLQLLLLQSKLMEKSLLGPYVTLHHNSMVWPYNQIGFYILSGGLQWMYKRVNHL